jgi:hypothetical protein
VPQVIREVLDLYRSERRASESFRGWVERTPPEQITTRLQPLIDEAGDSEETFVDWGDMETYSLKLGRGECAA